MKRIKKPLVQCQINLEFKRMAHRQRLQICKFTQVTKVILGVLTCTKLRQHTCNHVVYTVVQCFVKKMLHLFLILTFILLYFQIIQEFTLFS